jgi:hypothetical protein
VRAAGGPFGNTTGDVPPRGVTAGSVFGFAVGRV